MSSRIDQYLRYHVESARCGDIDPSYGMLRYVCDRFELSVEQRYWIAYLYATSYCGATAFYLYNEWPDFENVDFGRMERWWAARGRDESLFQTDRRWPRSRNQVVDAMRSYRAWIGDGTQHDYFRQLLESYTTPEARYVVLYSSARQLYTFGQFALFLYLEALHTITPLDLCPTDLDLDQAWSCRNGLYFAYGLDDLVEDTETRIRPGTEMLTEEKWRELRATLAQLESPPTVWQTETLLCAYRKWNRGKRTIGYYLDRQALEIAKMQRAVPAGVCWDVLWDYRRENVDPDHLVETHGHLSEKGVSRTWREWRVAYTRAILEDA